MRLHLLVWWPVAASGWAPQEDGVFPQPQFPTTNTIVQSAAHGRHKPVIWVHVHKAGGLAMCRAARDNNETLMRGADYNSCNRWSADRDVIFSDRPDCADHSMLQLASGFTWSQMEQPLLSDDICPEQFFYGTVLRHPVSLAKSMCNFRDIVSDVGAQRESLQWSNIASCLEKRQAGQMKACASSMHFVPSVFALWPYFDNFMVRVFGGRKVWALPPGGVNATHLQMAVDRLKRFDLVLTLEQMSSKQTHSTLAKAFGWNAFSTLKAPFGASDLKVVAFTVSDIERIKRLTSYDMILYEAFREREANP